MITFRKRSHTEDLIPEAIDYLTKEGIKFNIIKPTEADKASKVNSRALVLVEFFKNEDGFYQITVKDKEFYSYTKKILKDYFSMRILDENKQERSRTAETDRLGVALDIIEVLAGKYDLSIVK